jgi:hypothetical protein
MKISKPIPARKQSTKVMMKKMDGSETLAGELHIRTSLQLI